MTEDASDPVLPDSEGSPTPTPSDVPFDPMIRITENLRREVSDALYLLDYVVANALKPEDGRSLAPETVATIKKFSASITPQQEQNPQTISVATSMWIDFEMSYMALATFTSPITVETLRNTEMHGDSFQYSAAQQFAWLLWIWTGAFVVTIVVTGWALEWYGPGVEGEAGGMNRLLQYGTIVQPYLYGGLGACAYLLRSAHSFIYQRTFDLRRKPEYFNRILLGSVSGGAIILLVDSLTTDSGDVIHLSSAALGFIAGYSNDFLFNTVERVVNAIMPKIDITTVSQRPTAVSRVPEITAGGVTLKDLLDRHQSSQGVEKDMYKALIEKVTARL